jgi:ABC-type multidrug transport system fused ATPase/permease subunit
MCYGVIMLFLKVLLTIYLLWIIVVLIVCSIWWGKREIKKTRKELDDANVEYNLAKLRCIKSHKRLRRLRRKNRHYKKLIDNFTVESQDFIHSDVLQFMSKAGYLAKIPRTEKRQWRQTKKNLYVEWYITAPDGHKFIVCSHTWREDLRKELERFDPSFLFYVNQYKDVPKNNY